MAALSTLYGGMLLSSMFLPPVLIGKLGCKWTLVLAMCCYVAFSLGNFYASWYAHSQRLPQPAPRPGQAVTVSPAFPPRCPDSQPDFSTSPQLPSWAREGTFMAPAARGEAA